MADIVRMPKLGLEMTEGTVIQWLVDEGERIAEDEAIAGIETDKTRAEVRADVDGILRSIVCEEGMVAKPGDPIGIIGGPDENISKLLDEINIKGSKVNERPSSTDDDSPSSDTTSSPARKGSNVRASPRAKSRADELGIDLKAVEGTGPQGAITAEDVKAAADTGGVISETRPLTVVEERPLSGTRGTIAKRLAASYREAVHVTIQRSVDAEQLFATLDDAQTKLDAGVSLTDILLLATSEALSEHPSFNAQLVDGAHQLIEEHHICIAVDGPAGLVAPPLGDLRKMSLSELTRRRQKVIQQIEDREYPLSELKTGTFTVSNLGPFGIDAFTPIINPPQIAILGIGSTEEVAEPTDDGSVEFHRQITLSLSFDHRAVDGADAARLLSSLASSIETPPN